MINFCIISLKLYCTSIRNMKFLLMSLCLFLDLGRVLCFLSSLNFLFCCNEKLHFVSRLQGVQYVCILFWITIIGEEWARVQKIFLSIANTGRTTEKMLKIMLQIWDVEKCSHYSFFCSRLRTISKYIKKDRLNNDQFFL